MKKILFIFALVFAFTLLAVNVNADNSAKRLDQSTIQGIVDKVLEMKNGGSTREQIMTAVTNMYGVKSLDNDDDDDDESDDDKKGKPSSAGSKSTYAKLNFGQTKKLFRAGDQSEEVKALQEALNKIADDNGLQFDIVLVPDGKYGPRTVQVVKMIQAYKGLKADGVVGPMTLAKLQELLAKADPNPTNQKPVITLVGQATMTVTQGNTFTDPGYTATDPEDGNLTASVVKTGSVNTAVTGAYVLAYNVSDSKGLAAVQVTRTVNVVTPTP